MAKQSMKKTAAAEYIDTQLRQLARMAREADLETLGQLIELAALEAVSVRIGTPANPQKERS